jgi:uncharacterized coiled-coil DUF342 family protein
MGSKRKQSGNGVDKNSMEYREKRQKNNNAVKRSRDKTKQRSQEANQRVNQLMHENEHLKSTVDSMTRELQYLKDMLICQAGSQEYLSEASEATLEDILRDDAPTDLDKISSVLAEMEKRK